MENKILPLEWHNEKRMVKDLVPYEFNPRVLSEDKKQLLINSIEKYNLAEVPAINLDNVIIAGHQRIKVLMEIGRGDEEIDVRVPNRLLTEKEFKEYNIVSNIPVGFWEIDVLEEHFADIDLEGLGLFVEDIVVETPEFLEAKEDNYVVPKSGAETDIVLGDLFEIGNHRLICGDSTQTDTFEKLFNGNVADLVVTDPPYNVAYEGKTKDKLKIENNKQNDSEFYQFLYDFYTALGSYTKKGGVWYVWHADSEGASFRQAMKDAGIMVKQCLIWVKNSMVMGRQDYQWKHEPCLMAWEENQHDPCLYGWKEGAAHNWYSDRKQTTILDFPRPTRNAEHPTMKPVPLIGYQIENSSQINEIVADGFGGSGTTMVASEQLKRRCYMAESDPRYCQVIVDRMIELNPNIKVLRNGAPYLKNIK
jgi:DNA modification methylase